MSTTNMPVLEQACRNVASIEEWRFVDRHIQSMANSDIWHYSVQNVRAEYSRLLRLKKSKKRWRA